MQSRVVGEEDSGKQTIIQGRKGPRRGRLNQKGSKKMYQKMLGGMHATITGQTRCQVTVRVGNSCEMSGEGEWRRLLEKEN